MSRFTDYFDAKQPISAKMYGEFGNNPETILDRSRQMDDVHIEHDPAEGEHIVTYSDGSRLYLSADEVIIDHES